MTQESQITKAHWEQHWVKPEAVRRLLSHFNLTGLDVLELGSGTGELTKALLEAGVHHIEAWEIDPDLAPLNHPQVTWRVKDLYSATPTEFHSKVVIGFLPYDALPFVLSGLSIDQPALIMASEHKMKPWLEAGFTPIQSLEGRDFTPESKGLHWVCSRGIPLK